MRKIILSCIFITSIIIIGITANFASADWWGWSDPGGATIPYCQNGECTVQGGVDRTKDALGDQISDRPLAEYVQDYVNYLLTFLTIVAVLYIVYAGFRIMISNGDEQGVKKSRTTILYVAIGIVIIWLAYAIVRFIIDITTQDRISYFPRFSFALVETTHAAYTESEAGTFVEYKSKIQAKIEELEAEMRINKSVATSNLSALKQLVQSASDRLPDKDTTTASQNESAKRAVDMYIDLAIQKPDSSSTVSEAIQKAAQYINSAKTQAITGRIIATPTDGNAPLTVSFRAEGVIDPSGTTPPSNNYIWWLRENGGVRRELGRGASLSKTFTEEGTYSVFLDVVSASKNSRGYTDILPFSASVPIEVKPKLGEIILLVNGVNVTNLDTLKISPLVANQGIIFDASASRAIGNGKITKTNWVFGNGNKISYNGSPVIERQIYANQGTYTVQFSFETNDGQKFTKELQLIIRDPAAVIKSDSDNGHVGDTLSFSAESYYGESNNITYTWQIQDDSGNRNVKSANGKTFSYKFETIGTYIVTLTAKSSDGNIDTDSRRISIESREPVVSLAQPTALSSEAPNTFVFDASRSYNPDTNSRTNLTFTWRVNGQLVTLENATDNGSKGNLTFSAVGTNTVSVTVANQYGKITTAEQNFSVNSLLSVDVKISPQVAQVGNTIQFIGESPYADFFTWNMGDSSPQSSSNSRSYKHSFAKSGIYTISLTVSQGNNSTTNTATRKVYITDANNPLAVVRVTNASNSAIEEDNICKGKPAWIVNRGESTTFDGSQSINVDGTTSNLDYTWKYMGKVSTNSSINGTFGDLGCFPIELTVRSKTNGASNTSTQYIQLKNRPPELTSITTTVDNSKKDSQKVIVKATANGVEDPDGVVTSYVWYYTTETDPEPQNIQITQNPYMTFVLPNVTEKYYFGVILEDNDGARVNSADFLQGQTPLIIDNANGNVYLPLITLATSRSNAKAGESIHFSVTAKTILGTDITSKSSYAWDFDGDGSIDERTSTPSVDHAYSAAGDYNMKVRVTYNGVSNTKYQNISVRNELKASAKVYRVPGDKIFIMNTSQGLYDKALWNLGNNSYDSLYSLLLDYADVPTADAGIIGKLTVSSNDTDISSADISLRTAETVTPDPNTVVYQSYPLADSTDTIHVSSPSQVVRLAFFGNTATHYAVDTDLGVDSNLDGTTDNDIDNKSSPSYTDGSLFTISNFSRSQSRTRDIKITLYNGDTPTGSKIIHLVFDYISESSTNNDDTIEFASGTLTDFDREHLDALSELIRSLPDSDRIIVMQKYKSLAENWDSTFERAKNLIDIQEYVTYSTTISATTKTNISDAIDALLIGNANSTNEIDIAVKLIRDLIPESSPNYTALNEKLDAIASHPLDIAANKQLGTEMLELIQNDSTIEDRYKIHIRNQLLIITSGGSDSVNPSDIIPSGNNSSSKSGGGILGIIGTIVKIFFVLIAIFLLILIGLYVFFRINKKDSESGFQDFIIDHIFHNKKTVVTSAATGNTIIRQKTEGSVHDTLIAKNPTPEPTPEPPVTPIVDPLTTYVPPTELQNTGTSIPPPEPIPTPVEDTSSIPDWLKSIDTQDQSQSQSPILNQDPISNQDQSQIPTPPPAPTIDPLSSFVSTDASGIIVKNNDNITPDTPVSTENTLGENSSSENSLENSAESGSMPDWLLAPIADEIAAATDDSTDSPALEESHITSPFLTDEDTDADKSSDQSSPSDATAESTDNASEGGEFSEDDVLPDWLIQSAQETGIASESENREENTDETTGIFDKNPAEIPPDDIAESPLFQADSTDEFPNIVKNELDELGISGSIVQTENPENNQNDTRTKKSRKSNAKRRAAAKKRNAEKNQDQSTQTEISDLRADNNANPDEINEEIFENMENNGKGEKIDNMENVKNEENNQDGESINNEENMEKTDDTIAPAVPAPKKAPTKSDNSLDIPDWLK